MSAFRFVRQLGQDGFLDEESETLRLIKRDELMRRWQAAYLRPMPEMPLRWIDQAKNEHQVSALLRAFDGEFSSGQRPPPAWAYLQRRNVWGSGPPSASRPASIIWETSTALF